jgi:sodium/bile acid cotransporter 7
VHRLKAARRPRVDPYIASLLGTVLLACLLPARGVAATGVSHASTAAIALLFFLYGARLSTGEAVRGLRQWRLHGTVFTATFVLFPLLGLAARLLVPSVLTPQLYQGVLFLCLLPSTVQSSIAFTTIARGNTAAAVCSATFSSLFGIVLTPLLAAVLLNTRGGVSAGSMLGIVEQLLLPFVAGQLLRRWIAGTMARHRRLLGLVDRGSILLVVYGAFSEGVVAGVWGRLSPLGLLVLLLVDAALLALVLTATLLGSRRLGFSRADRIVVVFCGSKKSLASGVPMATVLFGPAAGLMVLPLMLFHQIQLMVCAVLARHWGASGPGSDRTSPALQRGRLIPGIGDVGEVGDLGGVPGVGGVVLRVQRGRGRRAGGDPAADHGRGRGRARGEGDQHIGGAVEPVPGQVVQGVAASTGQAQPGGGDPEERRVLEAAALGEEAVGRVHRDGAGHGPGGGRARDRGGQAEEQQRAAARLAEPGREGAGASGHKAHAFHALGGAVEPAAAEPAEELLRAVRDQHAAGAEAQREQAEILAVQKGHGGGLPPEVRAPSLRAGPRRDSRC